MRKMTIKDLHGTARVLTALLFALLAGFLAYMHFSFSALLIGEVKTLPTGALLITFNQGSYAHATQRLEKRRALPDHDALSRNPFAIDAAAGARLAP